MIDLYLLREIVIKLLAIVFGEKSICCTAIAKQFLHTYSILYSDSVFVSSHVALVDKITKINNLEHE